LATIERIIPAVIHDDGSVHYTSVTSPSDDSIAVCHVVPDRIIPVIFVPGIMGSNLQNLQKDPVWVVNSSQAMAGWALKTAAYRKQNLDPLATSVFKGGELPSGTSLSDAKKQKRGWGTVAKKSYGDWLVWLQNALDDCTAANRYGHDGLRCSLKQGSLAPGLSALTDAEVSLSYRYQMPVHAVGYNWLQSNELASKHLADEIDRIIGEYRKIYRCEKVILVTHSMGGLVARHCSEALGYRDKILGIVHGVMPATGSATAYKRVKAGWESDGTIAGEGARHVLGATAEEITAVFAQSAGALQLLPGADYGNGWLRISDGDQSPTLPQYGDPYGEIYLKRREWWGLIDDLIINPLDVAKKTVAQDWALFADLINGDVIPFHNAIAQKYHAHSYVFYGDDKTHKTWGDVVWKRLQFPTWLNDHKYNVMSARPSNDTRTGIIDVSAGNAGPIPIQKSFQIQPAMENGDGTVPVRSGHAPAPYVKACIGFDGVDHEGAYNPAPHPRSPQLFALWAITKLVSNVQGVPTMEYGS
jgi:pimeloyl-ACP methyl ester carboxylesterase